MLDFGKHAIFIWAAYGTSAAVLIALIIRATLLKSDD